MALNTICDKSTYIFNSKYIDLFHRVAPYSHTVLYIRTYISVLHIRTTLYGRGDEDVIDDDRFSDPKSNGWWLESLLRNFKQLEVVPRSHTRTS